jgi:uridine phosphorylase
VNIGKFATIDEMVRIYPLFEYDDGLPAVIEPGELIKPVEGIAEHAVLCFFQDVIEGLKNSHPYETIYTLGSEIGPNPVYQFEFEGGPLVVFHPGVGAPLAGAFLDELIALGCRKFIACGGAGVLDASIEMGQVLVPQSAVRDEGLSHHYLPPAREVAAHPQAIQAIVNTLKTHDVPYTLTKTWTTDAIYRETRAKVNRRRAEGCLTVEMEAAAFFAVAKFRNCIFGQLLYGGDNMAADTWDSRSWQKHATGREKLFWLAVEACLSIKN